MLQHPFLDPVEARAPASDVRAIEISGVEAALNLAALTAGEYYEGQYN